eukprot:scaffold15512_cov110-Isochrysis_galbana.AAC.3
MPHHEEKEPGAQITVVINGKGVRGARSALVLGVRRADVHCTSYFYLAWGTWEGPETPPPRVRRPLASAVALPHTTHCATAPLPRQSQRTAAAPVRPTPRPPRGCTP